MTTLSKKTRLTAQATVEKFSHDGRGIARPSGKTTFIAGALPHETVVFEYTRRKSDYDEGRVTEIIEASNDRVTPHCPHYAICGGCSLQHLSSAAQIEAKQALLLEVLNRIGHCQPMSVLAPITGEVWHYRNKARLSVRYVEKKGVTLIGFREKDQPRYIADIHTCPVIHARVDAQLDALRQLLDGMDDKRSIAQIELAAGDHDIALIIRNLSPLSAKSEADFIAFSIQTEFRIYLQPAGADSVYLLYPPKETADLTYSLPAYGLTYHFHPTDFTQVNADVNRQMVSLALHLLDLQSGDVVLDLFCGLGNFSLPIAQHCAKLIGVEGSQTMVDRASMNARLNHISNTSFLCANLEEWCLDDPRLKEVNKVLLDPPRCGALAIVKQIQHIHPTLIVYVSCNPVTLARDAEVLVSQGYQMHSAGVMDMFPHTAHVESIALFTR